MTITGASGIVHTGTTNDAGQYTVRSVPVGTYTARFELDRFKTLVREEVTLQVSQTLRLDAQLEVGDRRPSTESNAM